MLSVVNEDGTTQSGSLMDDIVRQDARFERACWPSVSGRLRHE